MTVTKKNIKKRGGRSKKIMKGGSTEMAPNPTAHPEEIFYEEGKGGVPAVTTPSYASPQKNKTPETATATVTEGFTELPTVSTFEKLDASIKDLRENETNFENLINGILNKVKEAGFSKTPHVQKNPNEGSVVMSVKLGGRSEPHFMVILKITNRGADYFYVISNNQYHKDSSFLTKFIKKGGNQKHLGTELDGENFYHFYSSGENIEITSRLWISSKRIGDDAVKERIKDFFLKIFKDQRRESEAPVPAAVPAALLPIEPMYQDLETGWIDRLEPKQHYKFTKTKTVNGIKIVDTSGGSLMKERELYLRINRYFEGGNFGKVGIGVFRTPNVKKQKSLNLEN